MPFPHADSGPSVDGKMEGLRSYILNEISAFLSSIDPELVAQVDIRADSEKKGKDESAVIAITHKKNPDMKFVMPIRPEDARLVPGLEDTIRAWYEANTAEEKV